MNKWPFPSIESTVVLSNVQQTLSSEGYEFGGYLFHGEEMRNLGQFAGSKLKRYGSETLLGVTPVTPSSLGVTNGNQTSSSEIRSRPASITPTPSKDGRHLISPKPSDGTAPPTIRPRK